MTSSSGPWGKFTMAPIGNSLDRASSPRMSSRLTQAIPRSSPIVLISWKKTALLLFGDQVCLAILAQAWSFSVLGWVGGMITTLVSGAFFWLTSMTLWRFCMKHPEVRDICDLAFVLFGRSRIAFEVTAFMLLANNILLIGFHILTLAKIFNTLSTHALCTTVFAVIATIIGVVFSIPRTLNHVSTMGVVSAISMGIAILLLMIFAGIEPNPAQGYNGEYPIDGPVYTYAYPLAGTTWVGIVNGVLNITFLWIPQILFPSFIREMRRPQDFPKALAALAIGSFVLFIVPPIVGFYYLGQYSEAPSFASLQPVYAKAVAGFVILPTVIIGTIYSNVTTKFIFRRILAGSRHEHSNSAVGWGTWIAVTIVVWVLGFIFAEVIPSMGDFLSLLGAAFDSQFGYLFWFGCHISLYKGALFKGPLRSINTVLHIIAGFIGLFLLGPGLYAAVEAIIADYAQSTRPAFSCADLSY